MDKRTIKRAAEIIEERAQAVFDPCSGAHNEPFCCGDCPAGNNVCKREHAEMVRVAKKLRGMIGATSTGSDPK